MEKTRHIVACVVLATLAAFAGNRPAMEILLSRDEWEETKRGVDTNGFHRVVSQNAIIVVTNGLPSVDAVHHLPIGRIPPKTERRRGPEPYAGQ